MCTPGLRQGEIRDTETPGLKRRTADAMLPYAAMPRPPSKMTAEAFEAMIALAMHVEAFDFRVEEIEAGRARLRLRFDRRHLRPGDTIAGPVMFSLADTTFYALVMSVAGKVTAAVTSDISIRFLQRPGPTDLIAEGRLIKDNGRLMVGEVTIYSDGQDAPVAHCTGTYAVPKA